MAELNDLFDFNPTTVSTPRMTTVNGIVPLTIRHIHNASGNTIQLFGKQYDMVAIVGIIRAIEAFPNKLIFRLEDHSAQISAIHWVGDDDLPDSYPSHFIQLYARVVGSIHTLNGTKIVIIFNIERVMSPNEVTTHLLEMLNARYHGEQLFNFSGHRSASSSASESMASTSGGTGKPKMRSRDIYRAVYRTIKRDTSRYGITRNELMQKCSINDAQLQTIIDYLISEGIIYSADSVHFIVL